MIKSWLFPLWLLISGMALFGCEEEYPHTYSYDTSYPAEFDISTTLNRFNQINLKSGYENPVLNPDHNRANHYDDFVGKRLYFHYFGETSVYDTVKVFDQNGDTIPGNPYDLDERRIPSLDTQYLNPEGYFGFHFWPEGEEDCHQIRALLQLNKDGGNSQIKLAKIRIDTCGENMDTGGKSMKAYLQETFEEKVISLVKGSTN